MKWSNYCRGRNAYQSYGPMFSHSYGSIYTMYLNMILVIAVCIYLPIYLSTHRLMDRSIDLSICLPVCIYKPFDLYIYTNTHAYIYIYIYIETSFDCSFFHLNPPPPRANALLEISGGRGGALQLHAGHATNPEVGLLERHPKEEPLLGEFPLYVL